LITNREGPGGGGEKWKKKEKARRRVKKPKSVCEGVGEACLKVKKKANQLFVWLVVSWGGAKNEEKKGSREKKKELTKKVLSRMVQNKKTPVVPIKGGRKRVDQAKGPIWGGRKIFPPKKKGKKVNATCKNITTA